MKGAGDRLGDDVCHTSVRLGIPDWGANQCQSSASARQDYNDGSRSWLEDELHYSEQISVN